MQSNSSLTYRLVLFIFQITLPNENILVSMDVAVEFENVRNAAGYRTLSAKMYIITVSALYQKCANKDEYRLLFVKVSKSPNCQVPCLWF